MTELTTVLVSKRKTICADSECEEEQKEKLKSFADKIHIIQDGRPTLNAQNVPS